MLISQGFCLLDEYFHHHPSKPQNLLFFFSFTPSLVLHEYAVGSDEIHDDGMVDDVVSVLIHLSFAVINPEPPRSFPDLFRGSDVTDYLRREFLDVVFNNSRRVTLRIDRNKNRDQFPGQISIIIEGIDDFNRFFDLFGTNIWAKREAEVDEGEVFPEIFAAAFRPVESGELPIPAQRRLAVTLRLLLRLLLLLFPFDRLGVIEEKAAADGKKSHGPPSEHLGKIVVLFFLDLP